MSGRFHPRCLGLNLNHPRQEVTARLKRVAFRSASRSTAALRKASTVHKNVDAGRINFFFAFDSDVGEATVKQRSVRLYYCNAFTEESSVRTRSEENGYSSASCGGCGVSCVLSKAVSWMRRIQGFLKVQEW